VCSSDLIFTFLDNGFKHAATSVSSANAINIYYQMCFDKYKAKEPKFTLETMLDKYNLLIGLLVQLQKTNHEKEIEYKTAQFSINNLTKEITTCENLSKYYQDKFENNKEKSDWLTNSLNSLSQNCANFPIYAQMAEANYKLKKTAQSAYFMGLFSTKQRKFTEAINYFKEAEELETDLLEKAKMDYSLATGLLANDYPKAKELLNRALSFNPSMGKAYLYLGTLYTNSAEECGKTEFDKKAIYYLAIQTVKKAIQKEPKLKPAFEKTIENYTPKSLKKEDIINQKLQGKSYTIGCWINETITFPLK
jgi:tetratricopeptide (TPR) repeat protein